jgi:hypothetical protein
LKNYVLKPSIFFILGVLLTAPLFSQIHISGQVQNQKKSPIPYAHITISNSGYGTTANSEGKFNLNLPDTLLEEHLKVTCIGYLPLTISIRQIQSPHIFTLKESEIELNAVTIYSVDYARELVLAAIKNIPNNYPQQPEMLTAFIRFSVYEDSTLNTPYYVNETLLVAEKEPYDHAMGMKDGTIKILENRKFEFQNIDSLDTRFYGETHIPHWGDLIARRAGPLSHPKHYEFEILDTLSLNDIALYQVKYDSKNKGRGLLYILNETYAIHKITLDHNQQEASNLAEDAAMAIMGLNRVDQHYSSEFTASDGLWRLKMANYQSSFAQKKEIIIFLSNEMVVSKYEENDAPIPYEERHDYFEPLILKKSRYNPTFWDGDNILLMDEQLKDALALHPLKDTSKLSMQEKLMKIAIKTHFKFGAFSLSNKISSGNITYTSPISIQSPFKTETPIYGLRNSIAYEITPRLLLGWEAFESFNDRIFSGQWFSLSYNYNLFPHSRPFCITPSVNVGYQKSRHHITTYDSENVFEISNKPFDADKVDVYLEHRGISLMPSLSLSIEKNSRWSFYVEGAYNHLIAEKQGLFFVEDEFFLKRKRAFVPASNANLEITYSMNKDIKNQFLLGFGTVMSF